MTDEPQVMTPNAEAFWEAYETYSQQEFVSFAEWIWTHEMASTKDIVDEAESVGRRLRNFVRSYLSRTDRKDAVMDKPGDGWIVPVNEDKDAKFRLDWLETENSSRQHEIAHLGKEIAEVANRVEKLERKDVSLNECEDALLQERHRSAKFQARLKGFGLEKD